VTGESRTSQGQAFETERKYLTHEIIIVGVDHYLDLIGSKVLDGFGRSDVVIEARYYKLLWKVMRRELLRKREIRDPKNRRSWPIAKMQFVFVDPLPDHLHQVLDIRNLCGSGRFALTRAFLEMCAFDCP